jgi:16S rRNA processing protein RimM
MGRIVAPYGVQGWIKIRPDTEAVDGLLSYRAWWLARDADWQEYRLAEGRPHGDTLIARLEGCEDRDQAAALRGMRIAVPRSALPAADSGEYYWCDLVGLGVENTQGESLGRIEEVFATGANDVLVVRGERERLIPFIDSVVLKVEIERSRVLVDWGADY